MAEPHPFPKLKLIATLVGVVAGIVTGLDKVDSKLGVSDKIAHWVNVLWAKLRGLDGKKIAIIGATASGKDSLIARLQNRPIPEQHAQTRGSEAVSKYNIRLAVPGKKEIEFKALKSANVGGETDERDRFWADVCREADIIIYLFDVERFIANREVTLARFSEDMRWMRNEGLRGKGSSPFRSDMKFAIVVNKIDRLAELAAGSDLNESVITAATAAVIGEVNEMAVKSLGPAGAWLRGVFPLSLIDTDLFMLCFSSVLASVASDEVTTDKQR